MVWPLSSDLFRKGNPTRGNAAIVIALILGSLGYTSPLACSMLLLFHYDVNNFQTVASRLEFQCSPNLYGAHSSPRPVKNFLGPMLTTIVLSYKYGNKCLCHALWRIISVCNLLFQLPGLFDGCQFFFHGKFNYPTPSREELASLVKSGGGTILTREPRLYSLDDYPYTIPFHALPSSGLADCAIFVIYDDTCPEPPHVEAQRMTCLPVSWLLDSIASFSLLDKTLYLKH